MKVRTVSVLAAVAALGLLVSMARAAETPDAIIKLKGGSVAAGIGYSWASGTLTYKDKTYEVEVNGLTVGDVGITSADAAGDVYHLNKLSDFDGNYTAVGAGITVAGGASAGSMKNQNGVLINLISTTQGVKFSFGAAGVSMKVKK
jgi:hypothetical protein